MIVDSSAIVAILLFNEADAAVYAEAIAQAGSCRISAVNFAKTAIVVESQNINGGRQFDTLIRRAGITIEPVTHEQALLAR